MHGTGSLALLRCFLTVQGSHSVASLRFQSTKLIPNLGSAMFEAVRPLTHHLMYGH